MKFYNNQPRVEKVIAIFQNILIFWRVLVLIPHVLFQKYSHFTLKAVPMKTLRSEVGELFAKLA